MEKKYVKITYKGFIDTHRNLRNFLKNLKNVTSVNKGSISAWTKSFYNKFSIGNVCENWKERWLKRSRLKSNVLFHFHTAETLQNLQSGEQEMRGIEGLDLRSPCRGGWQPSSRTAGAKTAGNIVWPRLRQGFACSTDTSVGEYI